LGRALPISGRRFFIGFFAIRSGAQNGAVALWRRQRGCFRWRGDPESGLSDDSIVLNQLPSIPCPPVMAGCCLDARLN